MLVGCLQRDNNTWSSILNRWPSSSPSDGFLKLRKIKCFHMWEAWRRGRGVLTTQVSSALFSKCVCVCVWAPFATVTRTKYSFVILKKPVFLRNCVHTLTIISLFTCSLRNRFHSFPLCMPSTFFLERLELWYLHKPKNLFNRFKSSEKSVSPSCFLHASSAQPVT